jgi:phosphoglycolate phosphatase-like HAD superfamily hydrolase
VVNREIAAPGDADPYVRCFTITQFLNRELALAPSAEALIPIALRAYVTTYRAMTRSWWSPENFRPGASDFLGRLQQAGVAVWLVSNADLTAMQERLSSLPGADLSTVGVLGNAGKHWLGPGPTPDPAFAALPDEQRLAGLPRAVKLKRGLYLGALGEIWRRTGATPSETLVVGDIYDMDLALPAVLGAHVHLIENGSTRPPYRAALMELGGFGSLSPDLLPALDGRTLRPMSR